MATIEHSVEQSPSPASSPGADSPTMEVDATFDPAQCLFCNELHQGVEANLSHMQKAHGLFIPARDQLLVGIETLLGYFHLVIFGYGECLSCGTQRTSPEAAQQHMTSKGHCKFDIEDEDSEYRDFYDFGSSSSVEGDTEGDAQLAPPETGSQFRSSTTPIQTGDSTLRLASGKTLAHRTAHKTRPARSKAEPRASPEPARLQPQPHGHAGEPDGTSSSSSSSSTTAADATSTMLTRSALRDAAFRENQLSRLRAADRQSLLHLPTSEQRALLAVQKKQLDKARRAEWAMRSRVEGMGNKTLMKHFVNDVPGRANG